MPRCGACARCITTRCSTRNARRRCSNSGVLSLRNRALAERLYLCSINQIARVAQKHRDEFEDIMADLDAALVDRYFCNFSLFSRSPTAGRSTSSSRSCRFHRLDEEPNRQGTLQDITCDSDGKIDRFVGGRTGEPSMALHPFSDADPYMLGIFLTGAYQEFSAICTTCSAIRTRCSSAHGAGVRDQRSRARRQVTEVLNYVQFRASDLLTTFRRKVQAATAISREEANMFIAEYVAGLEGYNHLEGKRQVVYSLLLSLAAIIIATNSWRACAASRAAVGPRRTARRALLGDSAFGLLVRATLPCARWPNSAC